MALTECPACRRPIPDDAPACPNCGRPAASDAAASAARRAALRLIPRAGKYTAPICTADQPCPNPDTPVSAGGLLPGMTTGQCWQHPDMDVVEECAAGRYSVLQCRHCGYRSRQGWLD